MERIHTHTPYPGGGGGGLKPWAPTWCSKHNFLLQSSSTLHCVNMFRCCINNSWFNMFYSLMKNITVSIISWKKGKFFHIIICFSSNNFPFEMRSELKWVTFFFLECTSLNFWGIYFLWKKIMKNYQINCGFGMSHN